MAKYFKNGHKFNKWAKNLKMATNLTNGQKILKMAKKLKNGKKFEKWKKI